MTWFIRNSMPTQRTMLKSGISLCLAMAIASCSNKNKIDDPQPDNENEVITTLIINLKDSSDASKKYVLKSRDLNTSDQIPAVFEIPELENNKTYYAEVLLLDESKAVADTVSNDVLQEADDHQLVYTSNVAGFEVSYKNTDIDTKGYPLGLHPIFKTKNIAGQKVNFQVVLYHLPGIKKANPMDNAKNGSADVDVVFSQIPIK